MVPTCFDKTTLLFFLTLASLPYGFEADYVRLLTNDQKFDRTFDERRRDDRRSTIVSKNFELWKFFFFFFSFPFPRDYLLFGYGDIHIHREAWLYKYDMAVNHAETRTVSPAFPSRLKF